jgi:hypothetical protein
LQNKILNGNPDAPFKLKARVWAVRGRAPGGGSGSGQSKAN